MCSPFSPERRCWCVDAVFRRRVRVGDGAEALVLGAFIGACPLCHAHKEPLVGTHAVARPQLFPARRVLPRQPCEQGSAKIRDIFAQRQFAVDLDVVDGDRTALGSCPSMGLELILLSGTGAASGL